MMYLKAEFTKLLKAYFIWILMTVYLLIFFLVFYQYTMNTAAKVIEPLLKETGNLVALFIALFACFFNVIFAVVVGGNIGAKDYEYNMIQNMVVSSGRKNILIAKIVFLFLISLGMTIFISIFAILLSLFHTIELQQLSLLLLLQQIVIGTMSTFMIGLFSMTIATLTKNTSKSNIICIVLFLGQSFLPYAVARNLNYINPYYYLSAFAKGVFESIQNLKFIAFNVGNTMSMITNVVCIIAYIFVCIFIMANIYKRREFSK